MQIILQKTVPNLGLVGDLVDVRAGYFRNYLGPRQLAILASTGSIKQAQHQKKLIEAKKIKEKGVALSLKQKFEEHVVTLSHLAGEGEKLYGSITNQELALSLRQSGFDVDKKQISVETPIKTLGDHVVNVKLHPEVVAQVKLTVTRKEGKEEKEPKEDKKEKQVEGKVDSEPKQETA